MQLHVGDRYSDESGEWEVVSRPVSLRGGKGMLTGPRCRVSQRPNTRRLGPTSGSR
jgi:hypothetical protein